MVKDGRSRTCSADRGRKKSRAGGLGRKAEAITEAVMEDLYRETPVIAFLRMCLGGVEGKQDGRLGVGGRSVGRTAH